MSSYVDNCEIAPEPLAAQERRDLADEREHG